jgi:hypothetical protein
MGSRLCIIEGCDKIHYGRGYCRNHWERFNKYNNPLGGLNPLIRPSKFFYEVVLNYESDECLDWPFALNDLGYGSFYYKKVDMGVYRAVCLEIFGNPPSDEKSFAIHSCGRPPCCNKRHIRWGSRSDNEMDKTMHGTSNKGDRHGNSKLTPKDVVVIRELAGKKSSIQVGKMFNVSSSHVRNIWDRKWWGWLEQPTCV